MEEESKDKQKKRWGSLGQLSILLWMAGFGIMTIPYGSRVGKANPGPQSLFIVIPAFTLIALATPFALLALKRRKREEVFEFCFAVLGLAGSLMLICLFVRAFLRFSGAA